MAVKIKICGIKNIDDAITTIELGADALGFVFAPSSRQMTPEAVKNIIEDLPPFTTTVGVFVNSTPEEINEIADYTGIQVAQLHGDELPEDCQAVKIPVIKAIRVKDASSLLNLENYEPYVKGFLLDTYVPGNQGGTGLTFNWQLVSQAKAYGNIILAGGLSPDNIADAIRTTLPFGVDVSSGVETNGQKDIEKISQFIQRARRNCNVC